MDILLPIGIVNLVFGLFNIYIGLSIEKTSHKLSKLSYFTAGWCFCNFIDAILTLI